MVIFKNDNHCQSKFNFIITVVAYLKRAQLRHVNHNCGISFYSLVWDRGSIVTKHFCLGQIVAKKGILMDTRPLAQARCIGAKVSCSNA